MFPSLVINISRVNQLPFKLEKDSHLLDLTNVINEENKLSLIDFFDSNIVYPYALKLYKEFIDKVVYSPNVLDIEINQFPVYWLTPCAVKHPIKHWGKDFFLLISILEKCQDQLEANYSKITIILPSEISSFSKSIEFFLKQKQYKIPYSITSIKQNIRPSFTSILKTFWWHIQKLQNYNPAITNETAPNTYLIGSTNKEHQIKTSYNELKKLFNENGKNISLTPIFEWVQSNSKASVPKSFLETKPTTYQLFKLFICYLITYFKTISLNTKEITVNEIVLPTSFLKNELFVSLNKNCKYFIVHLWLNNYFEVNKEPTKLFFDDEFYEFGRTISAASKKHKHVDTYGLQHGNFNEIHTVYTISDTEINHGIPIPTHFITWGEIFNQLFLMHNSLPATYTLALGYPKYVNNSFEATIPKEIKKVLWCLTTKECFYIEWEMIKNSNLLLETELTIRLHPLKHVNEQDVKDTLGNTYFTISMASSIDEAIKSADLVLTSAHSTVFIDALVNHKFCIRLTSRFWNGNTKFDTEILKTVTNSNDLVEALSSFLKIDNYSTNELSKIVTNKNYWKNV